jgi:hypothetical protein
MIVELAGSMVMPGSWPNKQQGQPNQPNNWAIAELIACKLVIWRYDASTQFSLWRKIYVKEKAPWRRKKILVCLGDRVCLQRIGIWRTCPSQSSPSNKQDECEYISIDRLCVSKKSSAIFFLAWSVHLSMAAFPVLSDVQEILCSPW